MLQLRPGVAGGECDSELYEFWNMSVGEVVRDFLGSVDIIQSRNPQARIILSVSPVSIIATREDRHVLVSISASKAILRAAADEELRARANIAYFPSYQLVTAAPNAARFHGDDTRRINRPGIESTTQIFFERFMERPEAARGAGSQSSTSTRRRGAPRASSATKRRLTRPSAASHSSPPTKGSIEW